MGSLAFGGFLKLLLLGIRDLGCLAVVLLGKSRLSQVTGATTTACPRASRSGFLLALHSASSACDREHQLINHSRKDSIVPSGASVVVDDYETSLTNRKV